MKTIEKSNTRGTYAGLLMATSESNRSYRRWSISASSYAKLIDEFAIAKKVACLVSDQALKMFNYPFPKGQLISMGRGILQ